MKKIIYVLVLSFLLVNISFGQYYFTFSEPVSETNWERGTTVSVKWDDPDNVGEFVKLELYHGSDMVYEIHEQTNNDGRYDFQLPKWSSIGTGNNYCVKIFHLTSGRKGMSDYFTISDGVENLIEVTKPNSSTTWKLGQENVSIKWEDGDLGGYVTIYLLKTTTIVKTIKSSTSNDGSYTSWDVPWDLDPDSRYYVQVIQDGIQRDKSDRFTIEQAGIEVTLPNSNTVWQLGQQNVSINWVTGNLGGNVKIELYKGGSQVYTVKSAISNSGSSDNWDVPTTLSEGSDYRIKITSLDNTDISSFSDYFTLNTTTVDGGTLVLTVSNTNGTSTPYPGANGKVKLYNNSNELIETKSTNSNGSVTFENLVAGQNYMCFVYHNGGTIFGEELWGSKSAINIVSNETTNSSFTRYMPNTNIVKVFKGSVSAENDVTGKTVEPNTQLIIQTEVTNFTSSEISVESRIIIDMDRNSSYDYDERLAKVISAGDVKYYQFSITPTVGGNYYGIPAVYTQNTLTDGWGWSNSPLFIVENSNNEELVASYLFNGNANDESGNGNNGTVNGATLTTDRFGNTNSAYSFDGVDDNIDCGLAEITNPIQKSFSLSVWTKISTDDPKFGWIVDKQDGGSDYSGFGLGYDASDDNIKFHLNDEGSWASQSNAYGRVGSNIDQWNHIVAIADQENKRLKIFVNGLLNKDTLLSVNNNIKASSGHLLFGGYFYGSQLLDSFKGLIDDIKIYNYAITEIEINDLYHEGGWDGTQAEELVASYSFNGNANDESGNGNNGTVNGATLTTDRFGNANSAYSFDGVDDWIDCGNLINFEKSLNISGWFKLENTDIGNPWKAFFMKDEYIPNFGMMYSTDSKLIRIYNNNSTYGIRDVSIELPRDKWFFISLDYDGTTVSVYYNDLLLDSFSYSHSITDKNNLLIGVNGKRAYYWNGNIDDFRIFNESLLHEEILDLYHEGGWSNEEKELSITNLDVGPKSTNIEVPTNGEAYIYYTLTSNETPVNFDGSFSVVLKYNSTSTFNSEAKFIEEGTLRITVPADALGGEDNRQFTISNSIQIGSTSYKIQGTVPSFTATKKTTKFTHSWDLFAGGSAGVSGSVGSIGAGASVSAAKLSIKGEGGVGFKIAMDEEDNLTLDRRMEVGVGASVSVPNVNVVVGKVDISNPSLMIKTIVGQSYRFTDISGISEKRKKMAEAGFMLETMSLGSMGISPTFGIMISAVVKTLNTLGGVNTTFNEALVSNYWGLGAEGKADIGLKLKLGNTEMKAFELSGALTLNAKLTSQKREALASYRKYNNSTMNIGTNFEITQAINFNRSLLSFEFHDNTIPLFDVGVGGEVGLSAFFNNSGSLNKIEINLDGGGDAEIFGTASRSIYNSTVIEIPGEYSQLIKDSGKGLAGLYFTGIGIPLGTDMVKDAVASVKETYSSLSDNPIKITTSEKRGKGYKLDVGVSLDAAIGVGLGIELGVTGKYYDEIEFPKKFTEVYTGGKNYLIASSNYTPEMGESKFNDVVEELFSGTVPLVKEALSNLFNIFETTVASAEEFIIESVSNASDVIGNISGSLSRSGKWAISAFSPNTSMILQKRFETPTVKQMYYSTNVKKRRSNMKGNTILEDEETTLIIVSETMSVSFTPEGETEPIDSVGTAIDVKMVIDEAKLIENDFSVEDKERIKIYRYDYDLLSWVLEGGVLNNDTLKTTTPRLGSFALGIELTNVVDNTPPEIYEMGPQGGSTIEDYFEIYGKIKDDRYGSGINLAESYIILNGDTLDISYNPTDEKIFYNITSEDSLTNGSMMVAIVASDYDGNKTVEFFSFTLNITSIGDEKDIPNKFKLNQNYPNPFNPTTTISFELPKNTNVSVNIYDIRGSFVTSVYSGRMNAGNHEVVWNGKNSRGIKVSSGTYFYQLKTDDFNTVKKMQLLK
ncbi:MAG: T9SS type A sorting domain-containing protein [Melioribacteraceae bacterium]|nr:T9SS type A sorting domain-containing protein [Melioribacteraceae bacterium]